MRGDRRCGTGSTSEAVPTMRSALWTCSAAAPHLRPMRAAVACPKGSLPRPALTRGTEAACLRAESNARRHAAASISRCRRASRTAPVASRARREPALEAAVLCRHRSEKSATASSSRSPVRPQPERFSSVWNYSSAFELPIARSKPIVPCRRGGQCLRWLGSVSRMPAPTDRLGPLAERPHATRPSSRPASPGSSRTRSCRVSRSRIRRIRRRVHRRRDRRCLTASPLSLGR